jgi:DNA-binding NtrC family response regulator
MAPISEAALLRAFSFVERACTRQGRETIEDGLASAIELTGARHGFIVQSKKKGELEIRFAQAAKDLRLDASDRRFCAKLVRAAIDEGRVLLVNDPKEDPSLRTVLIAPMIAAGDALGATVLHGKVDGGSFEDVERKILQRLVLHLTALLDEIVAAERPDFERDGVGLLLGRSEAMDELRAKIIRVAPSRDPVLVLGETGVGKELVARALHGSSPRGARELVARNCAAFPDTLLESELFGHEEGAFTGASSRRHGAFRLAHRSTLFLDEVGDMSPSCQVKLLRVLQEGEVLAVGGDDTETIDVRIVAATNRDLEALVEEGTFRSDLYHRLKGFEIEVPPLRDRRSDIPLLATAFLNEVTQEERRPVPPSFTQEALRRLRVHKWPGNVRELRQTVRRGFYLGTPETIDGEHLGFPGRLGRSRRRIDIIAAEEVARALREAGGDGLRAASILHIGRTEWFEMLKRRPELKDLKNGPDSQADSAAGT